MIFSQYPVWSTYKLLNILAMFCACTLVSGMNFNLEANEALRIVYTGKKAELILLFFFLKPTLNIPYAKVCGEEWS